MTGELMCVECFSSRFCVASIKHLTNTLADNNREYEADLERPAVINQIWTMTGEWSKGIAHMTASMNKNPIDTWIICSKPRVTACWNMNGVPPRSALLSNSDSFLPDSAPNEWDIRVLATTVDNHQPYTQEKSKQNPSPDHPPTSTPSNPKLQGCTKRNNPAMHQG